MHIYTNHNDAKHTTRKHIDCRNNGTALQLSNVLLKGTICSIMLSVFMPNVIMLSVVAPFMGLLLAPEANVIKRYRGKLPR